MRTPRPVTVPPITKGLTVPVPLSNDFNPRRPGLGAFSRHASLAKGEAKTELRSLGAEPCGHRHPAFDPAIACARHRGVAEIASYVHGGASLTIRLTVAGLHTSYCREARHAMAGVEDVCLCAGEACAACGGSLTWDEGRLQDCAACDA